MMTKSIRTIQGQLEVKSRSIKTGMQNKLPSWERPFGENGNHLKCYQCTLKLRGIVYLTLFIKSSYRGHI